MRNLHFSANGSGRLTSYELTLARVPFSVSHGYYYSGMPLKELGASVAKGLSDAQMEQLRSAFHLLDVGRKGYISHADFKATCVAYNVIGEVCVCVCVGGWVGVGVGVGVGVCACTIVSCSITNITLTTTATFFCWGSA